MCHARLWLALLTWVVSVSGDLYLNNPRGSNNRLNEATSNRKNANRLFDSQNNNRGGYNVGDLTDAPAGTDSNKQYSMMFFQSGHNVKKGVGESQLTVEWTNQHGCGGNEDTDPQKQNCNMVLQYMCEDAIHNIPNVLETLRDGTSTVTLDYTKPPDTETEEKKNLRKDSNLKTDRGLHEPWEFYDKCYMRPRNNGLFTADQNVKKNMATYTRQNPNGNRRGYECPEERDYYPYWHPTPWKDIAVLADNSSMCSHYQSGSFNTQPYHECVENWPSGNPKHGSRWNNERECTDNGGQWLLFSNYLELAPGYTSESSCVAASTATIKYIWAVPYNAKTTVQEQCLVAMDTPDCYEAPWSRSNHLGNGRGNVQPPSYTWKLPYFPSGHEQKCVFRMRYNISTDDYDPYHTNASYNQNDKLNIVSPVQDNTQIDVGGPTKLQMALNTDQTGRIFQDRTHVFRLMPRPQGLEEYTVYNLNVRGKRGNIVQNYPSVEYDFYPTHLRVTDSDLVHIQWTGSNTHNNNGGSDGQSGSDGEGKAGTDRNNIAQILDLNDNFPLPYEQTTMWTNAKVMWIYHGKTDISDKDLALDMSSVGYYRCFKKASCPESAHAGYIVETQQTPLHNQLDNAPASYQGAVLKFRKGTYHYMCTRNNNFTNRSQKGTITVS